MTEHLMPSKENWEVKRQGQQGGCWCSGWPSGEVSADLKHLLEIILYNRDGCVIVIVIIFILLQF